MAIGFEDLETTAVVCANELYMHASDLRLYPGLDAFVIGFPMGMTGGGKFPIWKGASIASEPSVDLDGVPKMYIDTATRKGMSGSPVYAQEVGYIIPESGGLVRPPSFGKESRFVGVYTGRDDDDPFRAQLGIVWKESAIVETIEHSTAAKDKGSAA